MISIGLSNCAVWEVGQAADSPELGAKWIKAPPALEAVLDPAPGASCCHTCKGGQGKGMGKAVCDTCTLTSSLLV